MKAYLLPLLFGLAACDLLSFNWHFSDSPPEGSPNMTYPIGPWFTSYKSRFAFTYEFSFTDSLNEWGSISLRPETDILGRKMMRAMFRAHNAPGITTDDSNCHNDGDMGIICNHNVYLHEDWPSYLAGFNLNVRKSGDNMWVGTILDHKTNIEHQVGSWTLQQNAGNIRLDGARGYVERVNIDVKNCNDFPALILLLELPVMNPGDSVKATLDDWREGPYCYGEKRLGVHDAENYLVFMGDLDTLPSMVQSQLDALGKLDEQEIHVA